MKVLFLKITLRASYVHSLKEKRMIIRSITQRLKNKFNISIAECDTQDIHTIINIGIVSLCESSSQVDSKAEDIINFIECNTDAEIINIEKDEEKDKKVFSGVYEGKTRFIRKAVRGGQCINYPGNIVIIGDVNSGAEVSAAGNVIVLGTLKGKVSAGTNGNTKAFIAAFSLQPELLKIAKCMAMSPDDTGKPKYPELAKIKDGIIIVEPYLPNKYIY